MKTIKTTTTSNTTESSYISVFGFKKKYDKTTKTVTTVTESTQIEVTPEVIERGKILKYLGRRTASNKCIKYIPEQTKTKNRYKRALLLARGNVHWLNAMSYGVSGGVLTNILTGTGDIDVNVALLALTTTVITITGLVKVYFDVQFKDSG
ncbi:hypothetical protein [Vibrio sp. 10N.239.312.D08]|uniref:hypothetical protein n=1 Tax=Vibrio sp. 10N.239.312.D08 TaxID=3229978 RepID=UPI00354AEA5D